MRVITGTARGKRLETLEGNEVRPTSEKSKEALFSAIQFEVEAAHVLDLFAGSGQLGIEALSRGAADCVFVDSSRDSVRIITNNVKNTGFTSVSRVLTRDALQFVSRAEKKYDIIFADPPYRKGIALELIGLLSNCLALGGVAAVETEPKIDMPETAGALVLQKCYSHGKSRIWLYRREQEDEQ